MKSRDLSTARRYARALLDVAGEKGAQTNEALRAAADLVAGNPALGVVLAHPTLAVDKKKAVIREIFGAGEDEALVGRLVDLLVARGRIELLTAVADAFSEAWNAARGVVTAHAVTAAPLSPAQQERLAAALSAAAGATVELDAAVDPSLLGGVRVTMAGRIYDGTVRGRLAGLRRHLEGDR